MTDSSMEIIPRVLSTYLCPRCQDIFSHKDLVLMDPAKKTELRLSDDRPLAGDDYERSAMRTHHDEVNEMAYAAVDGCYICNFVWRHFFPEKPPHVYVKSPFITRTHRGTGPVMHAFLGSGTHYLLCRPDSVLKSQADRMVELKIGLNSPIHQDNHIPEYKSIMLVPIQDEIANIGGLSHTMRNPPRDKFDESAFQTIRAWMKNCRTTHQCQRHVSHEWWPTRLLDLQAKIEAKKTLKSSLTRDIWAALGDQADGVRLIETAKTRPDGPYIALSHRWAKEERLMTTSGNYTQMRREIDLNRLPLTFQQAITVARGLCIRYLWIDSLCIIQGDEVDWMREVKQMGRVFSNSTLTLSATAGGGQLMQKRDHRLINPCVRLAQWKGRTPKQYIVTDFRFWDERVYRSPTNTRCWITQERWLSPCVLHFAFDQLLWECRELDASETFWGGLPQATRTNKHTGFKQKHEPDKALLKTLTKEVGVNDAAAIANRHCRWNDWGKVLETYCRTETTELKDRMLGLSTIAEQFAEDLEDVNVAGLWRKTIPGDMLWHVYKSRRSNWLSNRLDATATHSDWWAILRGDNSPAISDSVRPQEYLAPSWSWASVLGDIEPGEFLLSGKDEAMIDVLDAWVEWIDPRQPARGLKGGSLRLRGRLYPTAVRDSGAMLETYIAGLPDVQRVVFGDIVTKRPSHSFWLKPDQPEDYTIIECSCFLPIMMRKATNKHMRKYLEPLGDEATLKSVDARQESWIVYGLCVKPTEKRGEYQRLGLVMFSLDESDLFESGFRAWKSAGFAGVRDEHSLSLGPELYHAEELGVFSII